MTVRVSPSSDCQDVMSLNGGEHMQMVTVSKSPIAEMKRKSKHENNNGRITGADGETRDGGTDQNYRKSSVSLSGLIELITSTFDSPALESIYQNYFSKRRRTSIRFLLALVTVYNIVQIIVTGIDYEQYQTSYLVTRIAVTAISIIACILTLIVFSRPSMRSTNYTIQSGLLWITVYIQLLLDLVLCSKPLLASDSVGLFIFFTYITYAMVTFRLYASIIVSLITMVTHCIIVSVCMKNINKEIPQVGWW